MFSSTGQQYCFDAVSIFFAIVDIMVKGYPNICAIWLGESDGVKAKSRRERRQWWGVLGRRGSASGHVMSALYCRFCLCASKFDCF